MCDKAIYIDKENHISYLYKAKSLQQITKYEEAISCYDKVLDIDAHNEEAIKNKKIILEVIRKEKIINEIKSSYQNKDYSKSNGVI